MAKGQRFCPKELSKNGEAMSTDKSLYNDCLGWWVV